ncbi:MAG: DUF3261 domain-containing protein [Nitrospirota bacterium]
MKNILFLFHAAMIAGCVSIPFEKPVFVPLEAENPVHMVETFQASIPPQVQLLTTAVFEYNGQTFHGIGALAINHRDNSFTLACMNPMGVKLFEISGNDQQTVTHSVLAPLASYGDVASAIANDIRRMYFKTTPSHLTRLQKRKDRFIFSESSGAGDLEYIFGGQRGTVVEKQYREDRALVWRVMYFEYQEYQGKQYPKGIVYLNYEHGYRLTVRHKEMRFENN